MGKPAAKQGDRMTGTDMLVVMVPAGTTEIPTPMPCPFQGNISGGLSTTVRMEGKAAATVNSTATIQHTPPPGTRFQTKPMDQGTICSGSTTVKINGKAAARTGSGVRTLNPPAGAPKDNVIGSGKVRIG